MITIHMCQPRIDPSVLQIYLVLALSENGFFLPNPLSKMDLFSIRKLFL